MGDPMPDHQNESSAVTISEALLKAYADAHYRIEVGAEVLMLGIGEPLGIHPPLPAVRRVAIVTACNPFSEQLDPAENAKRQEVLVGLVEAVGLTWLPAAGVDPLGEWPSEPSLAVCDPTDAQLDRWMELFGQNAVVVAEHGGLAALRLHPRHINNRTQERGE
jgi:hypothetical protein